MNTHGFNDEEIEQILSDERQRRELVQEEVQRRIYCGELEATDGDSVQTMRDFQ